MVSKTVKAIAIAVGVGGAGVAGYLAYQRYAFGDIEVATVPSGINLQIDGTTVTSPAMGRVPVGPHTVVVPSSVTDSSGMVIPFNQWEDGSKMLTRQVNIMATVAGDPTANTFLASYSAGSTGQILQSINAAPGLVQDTQYFGVRAIVTDIIGGEGLFGCRWHVGADPKWTTSDFQTVLALTQVPGLDLVYADAQKKAVLITALDTKGAPMAGVSLSIWFDPALLAPIDSRTLLRMVSIGDSDLGDSPSRPIQRVTDSGGQAIVNIVPALPVGAPTYAFGQVAGISCSDQVDSASGFVLDQVDDNPTQLCSGVHVGDRVHIGNDPNDCAGNFGRVKTGFCCTRNGSPITTPISGVGQSLLHVRAAGTIIQTQAIISQTAQVRLAN